MAMIFDEIKPYENIIFGDLNKSDLDYLLGLINKYDLILRERIYVPETETIGIEIEGENANWEQIMKGKLSDWELVEDSTLNLGAELKSSVLSDTKDSWISLKKMCNVMAEFSKVEENCGLHVHGGVQALGRKYKSLYNFMKLWAIYEPIIFRFAYGEFLGPRPKIDEAAKSVRSEFVDLCSFAQVEKINERELLFYLMDAKEKAVNFRHYYTLRTLESRRSNGTFDPVIIQNDANVFIKLMLYSGSERFNSGLIDERMERLFSTPLSDSEIHVPDAIELIDLVFDNNVDKIYFLRQYLKDFEKGGQYVKAKPFTNPFGTLS